MKLTVTLIYFAITVVLVVGEVKCIIKAASCDWQPSYRAEAIYTISALTGFGSIVGWIDIEDK